MSDTIVIELHKLLRLTRPLFVFDLETTSLNTSEARIVEFGFQKWTAEGMTQEWQTIVNPCVPIANSEKHHVTDAMVNTCRACERSREAHLQPPVGTIGNPTRYCEGFRPWPTFAQLAPNVAKGFSDCDFAGKNVRYDLAVLAAEMQRAGVEWSYGGARIVDADQIEQLGEPRTLSALYEKYTGEKLADAHQALADVRATTVVLCAQLKKFQHVTRDLDMLHDAQWPGWIDTEGKFRFKDGVACFGNWGKYKNRPMRDAARDYWDFILKSDFSAEIKQIASRAKLGQFPERTI